MKFKTYLIAVFVFSFVFPGNLLCNTIQTYDFRLVNNSIIITFKTEQGDLNLLFDTGSSLCIIDSVKATQMKLPFLKRTFVPLTAGALPAYTTNFRLFSDTHENWRILAIKNRTGSFRIDGLYGAKDILLKEAIDIDFENRKISFGDTVVFHKSLPLINENKSVKGDLGQSFGEVPSIGGTVRFADHTSVEKVDLAIDTGCHYKFALMTADSLLIKSGAKSLRKYTLFSGGKEFINFGRICVIGLSKRECSVVPFFYSPTYVHSYRKEIIALMGIPALKTHGRVVINWPQRIMYVKK